MSIFHPFFKDSDDLDFQTKINIEREKHEAVNKTIRRLVQEHIKKGPLCSIAEIRDNIAGKNIRCRIMSYLCNDFIEEMKIVIDGTTFKLSRPLFPKREEPASIQVEVPKESIHQYINPETDVEGVVDFLTALAEWMPEYRMIEEKYREEERKKRIACDLAFDILKRCIGMKLEEKGYEYNISQSTYSSGILKIDGGKGFKMTMSVDLMEDFLEDLTKIVDSLPSRTKI